MFMYIKILILYIVFSNIPIIFKSCKKEKLYERVELESWHYNSETECNICYFEIKFNSFNT